MYTLRKKLFYPHIVTKTDEYCCTDLKELISRDGVCVCVITAFHCHFQTPNPNLWQYN